MNDYTASYTITYDFNEAETLTPEMLRAVRYEFIGDDNVELQHIHGDWQGPFERKLMQTDNLEEEVKKISKSEEEQKFEFKTMKTKNNANNRVYRVNCIREQLKKGPLLEL